MPCPTSRIDTADAGFQDHTGRDKRLIDNHVDGLNSGKFAAEQPDFGADLLDEGRRHAEMQGFFPPHFFKRRTDQRKGNAPVIEVAHDRADAIDDDISQLGLQRFQAHLQQFRLADKLPCGLLPRRVQELGGIMKLPRLFRRKDVGARREVQTQLLQTIRSDHDGILRSSRRSSSSLSSGESLGFLAAFAAGKRFSDRPASQREATAAAEASKP